MSPEPGWYSVAETGDMRWFDGQSFREVTLVDGLPRYRFGWGLPAGNYLVGAVLLLAFAVASLFVGGDARGGALFLCVAAASGAVVLFFVAAKAIAVARLAAPTGAPLDAAAVQPLPGTVEHGSIPAGWYAGPAKDKPRWWTGTQWTDYVRYGGVPHPTRGQADRVQRLMRRTAWIALAVGLVAIGVAVVALVLEQPRLTPAPSAIAAIALVTALSLRLREHRAMRPFTRPMLPPSGPPLA